MWIERLAQWVEANPRALFSRLVYWMAKEIETNLSRVLVGGLVATLVMMMVLITVIELLRYWLGLPPLHGP